LILLVFGDVLKALWDKGFEVLRDFATQVFCAS